jgi:hypothetical protein
LPESLLADKLRDERSYLSPIKHLGTKDSRKSTSIQERDYADEGYVTNAI